MRVPFGPKGSLDLNLPVSEATTDPIDVLKMVVSKQGVFVEDQRIIEFTAGDVTPKDVDQNDAQFIRPLYEALDKTAQKTREIASVNETVEFDGKIFIQADKDLPYSVLQKVLYTMSMAGYADVKLAVIGKWKIDFWFSLSTSFTNAEKQRSPECHFYSAKNH